MPFKDRDKARAYQREYDKTHEKSPFAKETKRKYYRKNREAILIKRKEYYELNKEKCAKQNKEWARANPHRVRQARKRWENKNPAWAMYHNAKRHAKDQELPFDIKMKDILIPEVCPVFNTPFSKKGEKFEYRPSLDKLIPKFGYVKGNIAVISIRANRLKNDGTALEHQQIADYMNRYA